MDYLPETKQGLIIYIEYAKKEIKCCEFRMKSMDRKIKECLKRLNAYEKSEKSTFPKNQ